MKFGIVVFPGSNCDRDCHEAVLSMGAQPQYLWHKDADLKGSDVIILPGGFSYGDYLRCGAIAKFSPVMKEVVAFANRGGQVLGICNGFQILVESGLLPGTLVRNAGLKFICRSVSLKLTNNTLATTHTGKKNSVYQIPIAHGEGNYVISPDGLKSLHDNQQIVFQYCDELGQLTPESNPNGSVDHIAGICNRSGNVLGLMPHPERVVDPVLGGTDGRFIFESLLSPRG